MFVYAAIRHAELRKCGELINNRNTVGLLTQYCLGDQIVKMRWVGHVARTGEEWRIYKVLVGKPEGKTPLGRPRRKLEDNIKMDIQEVGCGDMD
jgi:hypothetical protein